ncbi:hypothetical protein BDN72DRAFT_227118 [Pluteus cervinus]|uniref:Uncharacterized protein n=1 Tax=Pluteus cervinus TaxID=181527 RepID=A0ACD3BF99_9AGAR|nr:hypothetical protein BDN72DRAFT_227118 [Pluteus cervinus]
MNKTNKRRKLNSPQKPASRTTTRRAPVARGQLGMLPEMPLDVLYEIFSLLPPESLIALTRTTKALRNMLMSRSAITIWKNCLRNDPDLPPKPENLTEPAFANLFFSDHCSFCAASETKNVLWVFNVRCCNPCMKNRFANVRAIRNKVNVLRSLNGLESLLCLSVTNDGLQVMSFEEAHSLAERIKSLDEDTTALDLFYTETKLVVKDRYQYALVCSRYTLARERRDLQALEELRIKRRESIYEYLTDMGYKGELQYLSETHSTVLSEHPSVYLAKELTEKAWETLRPVLVEILEDVREKLEKKYKKALLKTRLSIIIDLLGDYRNSQPLNSVLPRAPDLAVLPQTMTMLFDKSRERYIEHDHFAEFQTSIPQMCATWRETNDQALAALLPAPLPSGSSRGSRNAAANVQHLALATTYFKCGDCREPISYPRILVHACTYNLRHGYRNREDDIALIFEKLKAESWSTTGNRVKFYQDAQIAASVVVSVCEFDPQTTTSAAMDEAQSWLECTGCSVAKKSKKPKNVYTWRSAIVHELEHRAAGNKPTSWRSLHSEEVEFVTEELNEAYIDGKEKSSENVTCIHCRQTVTGPLLWHYEQNHNIDSPMKDIDFCCGLDDPVSGPVDLPSSGHALPSKAPQRNTNARSAPFEPDSDVEIVAEGHGNVIEILDSD